MDFTLSAFRKRLGYKKDKRDSRDLLMGAYLPAVKLPSKIDYTSKMSPVRDQGEEGTCVGFATVVGMKEYQERLDWGKLLMLSPRFLYNECKKIDGAPDSEGTQIRAAMKTLKNIGVCREKYWPYAAHQRNRAKAGALADAKKNRQLAYARIMDLEELKASLVTKGPCVIGVQVFSGMMKARNGIVPMPKRGEKAIGGHAVCVVGYEESTKYFKFKNSWSVVWGDAGYGYLPYGYVNKYMMDAWSAVDIKDGRSKAKARERR